MKIHYKIIILFILIPFLGFSNDNTFISKQKNIKKTYKVNSDAGIDIDNIYGSISVSVWDEDKIDLDITIKVTGSDENWVNERLSSIGVDITALKSMVTAITKLGDFALKSKGSYNNLEINYTIKIPKNGIVKLNNKYGNIGASDLFSTTDINCSYGKINLAKLNGNSNTIQIDYCTNSTIEFLKNGKITSRYSKLKMNKVVKLDLLSDYSEIEINEGNDVKCNSKYGSVKIEKLNSLDGNANYLTIDVGSLSNQLKLNAKYSKISIDAIQAKANNINIMAGYTSVDISFQPNYIFDFDISVRYGDLKYENELSVSTKEEINYAKRVSGFNKKKGVNKISITSDYGNVKLYKKNIQ